jgi:hypothetical protein
MEQSAEHASGQAAEGPCIGVVINPHARKNRMHPRRAAELRRIVGGHGTVYETTSLTELQTALRDLMRAGTRYLVSHGGDGALNWMLNELLSLQREPGMGPTLPPLVPTNSGTIDFVAKKVGIHGNPAHIVDALVRAVGHRDDPRITHLDSIELVGEQRLADGRTVPFHRVGFAAALGGVGQRFFDKYYLTPDPNAATIVRIIATTVASQAAALVPASGTRRFGAYAQGFFAPTRARVTIDGKAVPATDHRALHAGAFDINLGGVFRVFPLAREPGVLHLQAGDIGPWDMVRQLPQLVRGRPIIADGLWERAGHEMTVEPLDGELLSPVLDGEIFRDLTHVTVRPGPPIPIACVRSGPAA